jgi:polysaccharide export outer membrane protein
MGASERCTRGPRRGVGAIRPAGAAILAMALAAVLVSSATRAADPLQSRTPSPAPSPSPEASGDYRVGPGDVLQLFVWKEPDLSRDVTVRVDGKVTVPLLGDIEAGDRTPAELAAELTKLYMRFLAAPQVTVGVTQTTVSRFYVLGQVSRPGDFVLNGRTTVLQGLALAGGFREFAKTENIVIIRRERGREVSMAFNYKRAVDGKDLAQNVALRPGDTILVP